MFCRGQVIGLAVFCMGLGLLLGSLLPTCLPVWLLSLALIAAGIVLFRNGKEVSCYDESGCLEKSEISERYLVSIISYHIIRKSGGRTWMRYAVFACHPRR